MDFFIGEKQKSFSGTIKVTELTTDKICPNQILGNLINSINKLACTRNQLHIETIPALVFAVSSGQFYLDMTNIFHLWGLSYLDNTCLLDNNDPSIRIGKNQTIREVLTGI